MEENKEAQGLPVHGYKPTQPPEALAAVNGFKLDEERLLRKLDALAAGGQGLPSVDGRWLAIGRTALEQAFMAINRAVFQPQRVELPEDRARDDMQHAGEDDVN